MVIVTHESYDSVLVGTGKQKGLELLSDGTDATWRGRSFQTVFSVFQRFWRLKKFYWPLAERLAGARGTLMFHRTLV